VAANPRRRAETRSFSRTVGYPICETSRGTESVIGPGRVDVAPVGRRPGCSGRGLLGWKPRVKRSSESACSAASGCRAACMCTGHGLPSVVELTVKSGTVGPRVDFGAALSQRPQWGKGYHRAMRIGDGVRTAAPAGRGGLRPGVPRRRPDASAPSGHERMDGGLRAVALDLSVGAPRPADPVPATGRDS
jgi:hypothetical protein